MYDYKGLKDPSHLHDKEVSPSDLRLHMHLMTGVLIEDIFLMVAVEPYHHGNPHREVSF